MREAAIELYREALDVEPDNESVRVALERMLQNPELKGAAAELLSPIYARGSDWRSLVGALEIQCEMSEDADERVNLLHQIARLYLEHGGAEQAFEAYGRAFRIAPENADTLTAINELTDTLACWSELANVYSDVVDQIDDAQVATDIHIRLADILADRLENAAQARIHYEAAQGEDPENAHVVDALEALYFKLQAWEELVGLLLNKVEAAEDLDSQKELLFRAAGLFEEVIDDRDRAVETYRMISELDPGDGRCIQALERLYQSLEQWSDYLEVLLQKTENAESLGDKKQVMTTIAQTYERELMDPSGAIETFTAIVELDESDLEALRQLDRLYAAEEQWDEQAQILAQQIALVEGEEAQLNLRFRLAQLHAGELDDIEAALGGYQGILSDAPEHDPTLLALQDLIRQDRETDQTLAILEAVLEDNRDWARLISVWQDYLSVGERSGRPNGGPNEGCSLT